MSTLRIEGELNIVQAAAQRDRLLAWIAETDPARTDGAAPDSAPTLDLAAVEGFDSAGAQLLLALRHSLANRGQVLQLHAAPEVLADALRSLGLQDLLHKTDGQGATP